MKHFVFVAALLFWNAVSAQYIGFEEIDDSKVSNWTDSKSNYQGSYHFGDSEAESTLILIVSEDVVVAQILGSGWSDTGEWFRTYRNLTNVRIENSKFISDDYKGNFVVYNGTDKQYGLKIVNSWSGITGDNQYEIGTKNDVALKDYFAGDYSIASHKLLTSANLAGKTASELQIMRNEIFARYGYIFNSGGKMEAHFKTKKWYTPSRKNVNALLTEIETRNIQRIRAEEAKK